jgi:hypothetical protein
VYVPGLTARAFGVRPDGVILNNQELKHDAEENNATPTP